MAAMAATVKVDERACVGCGACVADCFPGAMRLTDEGVAACGGPCLECGHCIAVCPADAVSIEGYDPSDAEALDGRGIACGVDGHALVRMMKARRSIRAYEERPLSDEALRAIIEAGSHAPTARNSQQTSFIVIQKEMPGLRERLWRAMPDVVRALEADAPAYARTFGSFARMHEATGRDPLLFNAPAFIAVATGNMWDGGLAAAYMELAACAYGAGMLHSGYLKRIIGASPALKEWLGVKDAPLACCMLAGYPAVRYRRTAPRKPANAILR